MAFVKHIVRYGVITALVAGTAAVVAGPDRVCAIASQARSGINSAIDSQIDDPVALRQQMRRLAGQYPERIASVQRDLGELKGQEAQLASEAEVSERVVNLASADLEQIQGLIGHAEITQTAAVAGGEAHVIRVRFGDESLDMKQAYGKARSIQQVQQAYAQRAQDIQRDLGYLSQQESRLTQLLGQLQQEYTDFQTQMWQMDRQVDTIARNERLIAMMEKRQRTLDEQGRYGADSMQQLASRFADIRSRQEARLETLAQSSNINDYEDRAKLQLDAQRAYRDGVTSIKPPAPRPTVIEITPSDLARPAIEPAPEAPKPAKPIAMGGR
jgi:DNA repair exonuclease SbcCD ATPase subunit